MPEIETYDVIQVGYGPVGQANAALLGRHGWKVGVFERHSSIFALPRFAHCDHEVVRLFQVLDIAEEYFADAFPVHEYIWTNQHGETLLRFDTPGVGRSGWPVANLNYQPYVEVALDRAVRQTGNVAINQGWEAIAVSQDAEWVQLTLRRFNPEAQSGDAETRIVRGRYLIGADGANSFVRDAFRLESDDLGFKEEWLVVDLRGKRPIHYDLDVNQVCDPARPWVRTKLGKTHWRYEFMKLPDDVNEQLAAPEMVWKLLSDRQQMTADDAELIRSTVYQFRSRMLRDWRSHRVLIMGDAAHLMPPFMGQGACSGFRDAANLAWKLDLVLRGRVGDELLDTYQLERSPHVRAYVDLSVHVGKIACTTDPAAAAARDAALTSGHAPPPPAIPGLAAGILYRGDPGDDDVTGKLGVQGRIRLDGHVGLADDITQSRYRWQLISRRSVERELSSQARDLVSDLDITCLTLDEAEDVDGSYATYLDAHQLEAILVRPDFYVYGAAKQATEVDAMLADLRARIGLREAR